MAKMLLLFAHPALEKSRVHRRLIREIPQLPQVTFNDLYEHYPDFMIDVKREQELLLAHDLIVLQHPMFWYSAPALVKQWMDLVLEHGWAYGSKGNALQSKRMFSLISTGGTEAAYQHGGYNRHTIRELLLPIEQSFRLCKMQVLPPYIIHGTHRMTDDDIRQACQRYRQLLQSLADDTLDHAKLAEAETLQSMFGERVTV
jgi:glutathione-regulated potassium-efflux system ancillary protein KefG